MGQFVAGFLPSGSRTPTGSSGATIFGGAGSIHAALGDGTDTTGVHIGTFASGTGSGRVEANQTDHLFITTHHPGVNDVNGNRINYLQVQYRSRFSYGAGWIYPRTLVGLVNNTTRHEKPLFVSVGDSPTTVSLVIQQATVGAADGTPWNDCDHFEVEWAYVATPNGWGPTNYPYVTEYQLNIGYSVKPLPISISPTGTVTTSRPAITWAVTNGPQNAYRVAIVPSGATDAAGKAPLDSGFDPLTASGLIVDSGKVHSSSSAYTLSKSLNNGTVFTYLKVWEGSGSLETEGDWTPGVPPMVVAVPTVDAPTVTLSDDTASNTVQVQIAPGAHTADQVATSIEVQYLDGATWVPAAVPGGLVSGTVTSLFYDGLKVPGAVVSYRARGIATNATDGLLITSAWVTATRSVGNLHQHWLKSTTDHTLNRSLSDGSALLLRAWQPKRTRPASISYGIGARTATVVHDITKADMHSMSVWALTSAAYDSLRALLESEDDLIFVSEWGEVWRVQPTGDISEDIQRAAPRSSESTPLGHVRVVSFSLVEVVTP